MHLFLGTITRKKYFCTCLYFSEIFLHLSLSSCALLYNVCVLGRPANPINQMQFPIWKLPQVRIGESSFIYERIWCPLWNRKANGTSQRQFYCTSQTEVNKTQAGEFPYRCDSFHLFSISIGPWPEKPTFNLRGF